MAKIELWCNSGANIYSCKKEVVDTVEDWGYEEGEWESLTEDEKYSEAEQWAWNAGLEIGVRDLE